MIPIKVQPISEGKKCERIIYIKNRDDMVHFIDTYLGSWFEVKS